jgi:hypothetical protein
MSIALSPSNVLIMMPLLVAAGLFLCAEFNKMLQANPNTPVLSIGKIQEYIVRGAQVDI